MARRQKEWANRKRQEMLELLRPVCRYCGSTEHLQFDCIVPQGDTHHRYDPSQRISFYRLQLERENLQVLCRNCNARKGNHAHLDNRTA
jgi:5-methylcytosine-specific restriction endonuclease McrA